MTNTSRDPQDFQMDLMDHLRELRKRLIIAASLIFCGMIAAYAYASPIFAFLCAPFFQTFGQSPLIGTGPTEAFTLKLKVSMFAGALLTSPLLFQQLWLFIAPGLYEKERSIVLPFIFVSTILFLGGVMFCYYVALPTALPFFKGEYESIGATPTIKVGEYLSMTITTLLGFGVIFEMPVLTFFLAKSGIIDHRFLIDSFRYALLGIFVVAAVLTPPDVMSQILMAVPLVILYGISIIIAWWAAPPPLTPKSPAAEPPTA